ncbi:MAG: homoserine dehydrogenase [Cyclobacteriaceae bacterium]
MMKKINLGVFGFGCVGTGLWYVLEQTNNEHTDIKKICIKNPDKDRSIDSSYFTTDKHELLDDSEIDVIVELIDDADAAFDIVKEAMEKGKGVISANKKMIAENLQTLMDLQQKHNVPFLYEGSSCASIPIIRNLEEYYDNDMLSSVSGIFNGSTNFILTKMIDEGSDYNEVLKIAQQVGFAETDPSLDVEGIDAKYKLVIIIFHAFGLISRPEEVFSYGITRINPFDIKFAKNHGFNIKLIAKCQKIGDHIDAYVIPSFVDESSTLSFTKNEYNAVILESAFSENQLLYGKGAGDKPTGSAVLSDISALNYDYKYEYKKYVRFHEKLELTKELELKVYVRYSNGTTPNFDDFEHISEKYYGENDNYITGTIKLSSLENASWKDEKDISVIAYN